MLGDHGSMLNKASNLLAIAALLLLSAAGRWYWHKSASIVAAQITSLDGQQDGQHDFDFYVGKWHLHNRRLLHPLTGSKEWVEFDGTSMARKMWDGRANVDEFEADAPSGHIEGMTVRLYNADTHQWSIYWANGKDATLGQPMIGAFKNGRGEFFDQEPFNGRAIFVRYVWSEMTPTSAHFEQSFSDDGGKTWEVNWITDQTRVPDELGKAH
jgi:hypothetical protein